MNAEMLRFKVALEAGQPIPPDIAERLCGAIDLLDKGITKSLCAAMNWRRGRGERKPQTVNDISIRNHYLRVCICRITGKNTTQFEWHDYEQLAEQINRWDTVTRKNKHHLELTPVQQALKKAESFAELPKTSIGLWHALTKG